MKRLKKSNKTIPYGGRVVSAFDNPNLKNPDITKILEDNKDLTTSELFEKHRIKS